ncbi:hypothetical protein G153_02714 [Megasphaera sp. BL7]|uniref:hypothetical protein n=1 Tax=unclassified Megasphaera TaxID=2626256 RepID=UPI000356E34D|nr:MULTISPECIES: hypothetical protein [unclassified Megasphaera]EPP17366.1 hypothetical protein G153_02714 [Megasphaera sp. BL7]EPP18659.1 hypothetical protein NM10_02282 [Megasphaera sp. NM10]
MKVRGKAREITVTQRSLADAIGLTPPRISQLIQEGIVIRDEKDKSGGVFLVQSILNYKDATKGSGGDEDIDYMTEKARHEKTKREIAELRLAKMEHRVYSAKTVELVMTEMLSNLRTQLLGLPTKLAPQLEGKTKEEIYARLTKELEEKLSELSEYSPDLFTDEEVEEEDEP